MVKESVVGIPCSQVQIVVGPLVAGPEFIEFTTH